MRTADPLPVQDSIIAGEQELGFSQAGLGANSRETDSHVTGRDGRRQWDLCVLPVSEPVPGETIPDTIGDSSRDNDGRQDTGHSLC